MKEKYEEQRFSKNMRARDDLVAYLRVDLISFLNENIDFVACLVLSKIQISFECH